MESIPEQKYSQEKYDSLYKKYSESDLFYSEKAMKQGEYLREKYPDFQTYAFYHILGGSGISESIDSIQYEDFPKVPEDDSIESFIDINLNQG